jgi:KDO2-lipid IV(A) lauroyltransferase
MTDLPQTAPAGAEPEAAPPDDETLTLGQRVSLGLYTSMERVAMTWPERPARALFRAYGAAGFRFLPKLRATVARNYAQVMGLPPDSKLVQGAVREGFELYARFWYESFAVRSWSKERMDRTFIGDGSENIDKALANGRGCIVALPHMGNWDAAGKWVAGHWKIVAVAEVLRPRRMYELFLQHRRDLGMEIVPLTEDGSAGFQLTQMLADNYVVALVADRDLGGRGVACDMFGRIRRLPPGPAMLSLSTGAPLLSCPVYTTDTGWITRISEPLQIERTGNMREDVTALTRVLAADWERAIAGKVTDWHMFQPAWDFSEPETANAPGPATGEPAP